MFENIKKFRFKSLSKKSGLDVIFVIMALVLGVYLHWSIPEIIIFGIFIWTILHPVPSRHMVIPVLIFLALTPFFLIAKKEAIANSLAIYAYYFLVMTIMMAIYETWKEGNEGTKNS